MSIIAQIMRQPFEEETDDLSLRVTCDDPAALDRLLRGTATFEWVGDGGSDYLMSEAGAIDLYHTVYDCIERRCPAYAGDYDYNTGHCHLIFANVRAQANFIGAARWMGAAISTAGIAIPAKTAREIAALMQQ